MRDFTVARYFLLGYCKDSSFPRRRSDHELPPPIRNRNSFAWSLPSETSFSSFPPLLLLALFSGGVLRATAEDLYAPQGASPTALPAQATTPSPPVSGDLLRSARGSGTARRRRGERRFLGDRGCSGRLPGRTPPARGHPQGNAAYLRRTKTALEDRAVLQKELPPSGKNSPQERLTFLDSHPSPFPSTTATWTSWTRSPNGGIPSPCPSTCPEHRWMR
jgi:hypothetical protein